MLSGVVQKATPGALGFDVDQVLSYTLAGEFVNAGYKFCLRYIPRTTPAAAGDLTNAEATSIVNGGLALMVVQHVSPGSWSPSAALGQQYGSFAASYALNTVGLPPGVNVWLDLEMVASGTPVADTIAYCTNWYNEVKAAGYIPGLYSGYQPGLTPEQLYDLPFESYWLAYNGTDVPERGFQLIQSTQKSLHGIPFDPNTSQLDKKGSSAFWLGPQT